MKHILFTALWLTSLMADAALLPADWNAKQAADKVLAGLVSVTAPQVRGAHDSDLVIDQGRAFIVYMANDRQAGEAPTWPFIYNALSIVNLQTLAAETQLVFAASQHAYANETLPEGACFVPRILRKDDRTLRCFFASEAPGRRQSQVWCTDFDLVRMAFDNRIQRVKIKTTAGTVDMQPQYFHADAAAQGFRREPKDYGLYLFDACKAIDGKTYVALNNYPGGQNALAVANDSLDTFEVLGHYNEPQTAQLSESAVNRLPDGTWMAICRNDKGNYHFSTSADGRTWSVGRELPFVTNGANSKPTFDRFGGIYYLGWQERTRIGGVSRSVFNVDISTDGKTWERKYRFETEKSFQYPTFRQHQGSIYLTVTYGDTDSSRKERIMFGKLEPLAVHE